MNLNGLTASKTAGTFTAIPVINFDKGVERFCILTFLSTVFFSPETPSTLGPLIQVYINFAFCLNFAEQHLHVTAQFSTYSNSRHQQQHLHTHQQH